ncbi:MAG: hypothetical protein KJO59_11865 [Ignavibacteria bacterium]|nr:hypothetical protein [Ignavibacteria bacterium]
MRKSLFKYLPLILIYFTSTFSQVENLPLNHPVYTFLKEMKVKKIISYINEDIPNLSRFEVRDFLVEIDSKIPELSGVEIKLLNRYKTEFYKNLDEEKSTYFFQQGKNLGNSFSEIFSNKLKYLYAYEEENANVFINFLGHYTYSQLLKPEVNNAHLYDFGLRVRGTFFKQLGYHLSFIKGGVSSSRTVAEITEPRLLQSFKWIEKADELSNYDFTEGYIKFHSQPAEKMNLSIQLGREPKTVGYGYGNKLMLSGLNPVMDFLQFNFSYGILHYTSIHGSTVGRFDSDQSKRYTKYWAFNRLKLSFENLFDIGIGESIVYSGRGIELAYLTPFAFYKFIEHSLQDRDNGNLYFDLQTSFIKNLELQATFLLDENILFNWGELNNYINKTGYQIGAFWYQPFSIKNLSLIFEYTKIRPFVYSHKNFKNTYTAWEVILGHPIGPNSDEIFTKSAYNFNDWIRLTCNYRYISRGENVYNSEGNLIKNVGGDVFLPYGPGSESEEAPFLDGVRIDNNIFEAGLRVEPIRDFIFDLVFNYNIENNITESYKRYLSYGFIRFTLEY